MSGARRLGLALVAAGLLAAAPARALPRFAVRTGLPCAACHVNPTGGGLRSPFGRDVFARQWLPLRARGEATTAPAAMEVAEHVTLGADLRAGTMWLKSPRPEFQDTSTVATMEANLYLGVEADPRLTFYLAKGAYAGFETFGLIRPLGAPTARDLTIKVGRFVLPFGLRDSNHSSYVREGIGFGPTDRDSGVEVGASYGRVSAHAALSNGTYGDAFFDTGGTSRYHLYDKAVSVRLLAQSRPGPLRTLVALSGFYNLNAAQQNPLFVPALFPGNDGQRIKAGVDELRLGAVGALALGRLSYRGEVVAVRDRFADDTLRTLLGYVTHQELALAVVQGVEVMGTFEFADSDVEFRRGWVGRAGAGLEWFPFPALEVSLLARDSFGPTDLLIGARRDVLVFVHVYL